MSIRVLFVDDENATLGALRDLLHKRCRHWHVGFALGGINALKILERESFDVLVLDLNMPIVDGADLLIVAKTNYPKMAQIVLSGKVGSVEYQKELSLAHAILKKPCSPDELIESIENVSKLNLKGNPK